MKKTGKSHASLPRRRDQVAASRSRHGDDRFLELEFGSAVAEAKAPSQGDVACIKGVVSANRIEWQEASTDWKLDTVAGRFVEISSPADTCALTICASLILEAQWRNEPVAWISVRRSLFFPPDFAARGIDLKALPIIRVLEAVKAARMADTMLRSGGLGVLVIDLGDAAKLTIPMQTRLAGLAKKHHTALICITSAGERIANLGSLVSLRGEARKVRAGFDRFQCELRAVKDKRQSKSWKHTEVCRGPGGLC